MHLTAAQQQAISARGNVLVMAGAGTGKTRTLVERCLDCLVREPRAGLDELLVVTFTEAAAAEMRQRIRQRLEEETLRQPAITHWQEQLALFESAHIGTLHSFCLQLVRQHFYQLGLDPQLTVLPQEEARLLADETLDGLLQKYYAGRDPAAEGVQQLIHAQGAGSDDRIRSLVLRLHEYSQTLPDAEGWLGMQLGMFQTPEPKQWRAWLKDGIVSWRQEWLATLERFAPGNRLAHNCIPILQRVTQQSAQAEIAKGLAEILQAEKDFPRGNKAALAKPLKELFADAALLLSLIAVPQALAEDWDWVRGQMATLLEMTRQFSAAFHEAKRELGVVDFHDLEQGALELLWDRQKGQPTAIAEQWRRQLRFIFVDEYQDINAAQDKIIEALSRSGTEANRFLVGDIKQSIYRFRLADPYIFQGYVRQWRDGSGQVIPLVDNFRSREGLLEFINSLFERLMRPNLGGLAYDEEARLQFGAATQRPTLAANGEPCVEWHIRLKVADDSDDGEEPGLDEVRELQEAEKEARLLGLRLRELRGRRHPVWDEMAKAFRPVEWNDMAILLRAPGAKAESYAKEFSRLGIPLQVTRGGFYRSLEISDLLSLLQLLDNPLQDIPALAVLRSPLVGLSLDELALIRLALSKAHFWTALLQWVKAEQAKANEGGEDGTEGAAPTETCVDRVALLHKVSGFLARFNRWRRLARQVSLSRCLEAVLAETLYADWLLSQPQGAQRHANVQRLLILAEQFDQFQRQGLFRFLRFIEAQQRAEAEPEVAATSQENAVRLISIHQSKGLEFPLVAVADLGKLFNTSDLREHIILDEQFGLCPKVKPPQTGRRYPSLPYWLARRHQARELLGEELRLLYVALTRACDTLVLSASITPAQFDKVWRQSAQQATPMLSARTYADWLGVWFAEATRTHQKQFIDGRISGESRLFRWTVYDDHAALLDTAAPAPPAPAETGPASHAHAWQTVQQRLLFVYPFQAATRQPAKTSVSALRRRAASHDPDVSPFPVPRGIPSLSQGFQPRLRRPRTKLSAAEIGTAHHLFLRLLDLGRVATAAELRRQAEAFESKGTLDTAELKCLEFDRLAAFWDSDLGRKLRAQAPFIRRELPFTARFPANEVATFSGEVHDQALNNEFVVVQGVADLVVLLPDQTWLLDFKTDEIAPAALEHKTHLYAPQLQLYARALAQIYRRPVTHSWLYFLALGTEVVV